MQNEMIKNISQGPDLLKKFFSEDVNYHITIYFIAQKMLFTPPDQKNKCSPKIMSSTYVINHLLLFPNMQKSEFLAQRVTMKIAAEVAFLIINRSRK